MQDPVHLGGTICQLGSASMLRFTLKVQGQSVISVVDTAAEVTIISDKVFESFIKKPPIKRKTTMQAAGRGMHMDAFVVGPVELKIGERTYRTDIYVAPIDNDMLLGLDFLVRAKVILDCRKLVFFINGEALPMVHGDVGLVPPVNAIARVAKITVPHRTVIPPNSVVQLESDLSAELTDFIIEPNKEIDLLIPRGYYNASVLPCVSLLNVTNNKIVLQKGTLLGEAIEADVVETGPAPSVATTGIARDNNPLPEQLQNILDKSTSHQDCKSFEPIGPHTVLPSSLISDDNLLKQDNTQHIHVITEDNTRPDSSIPQDEDQNVTSHVNENLGTSQVQQQVFDSTNQYIVSQNQNVCHSSVEIVTTPLGMSVYATYLDLPNVNAITETGIEASTYSPEQLRDYQSKDPDLELILVWFRDKTEPSEATIFRCSPIAKKYWINKDMFYLDDNEILRNLDKKDRTPRLVVPRDLVEQVISLCHDIPAAGHQEAYEGTPLPFPPGEQRGDERERHDQEVKKEPDDVLDLHDINYIDWTDIQVQVPRPQEPTEESHSPMVQVEVECDLPTVRVVEKRDSSRVIITKEKQIWLFALKSQAIDQLRFQKIRGLRSQRLITPMQKQHAQQPEVKHYEGNKHSTCPIPTCGESTKKMKHHCWVYHLPYIFKDLPLDKFEKEPSFQKLRGEAIQKLAWWIVGQRATVYDLVRYVNSNNILPRNCTMMQRCQDQMRNVTVVMNWYPPAEDIYTMYPVNSPAVLMQWRILITLLSQLSPARRAEFRRIGSDFVLPPMARQQPPVKRKAETAVKVPVAKSYKSSRPTEGRNLVGQSGRARESKPPTVSTVVKTLSNLQTQLAGKPLDAREILNRKRQSRDSSRSEDTKSRKTDTHPVIQVSNPVLDKNNNVNRIQKVTLVSEAFDSHFHLDRASILLTGSLEMSVEQYLQEKLIPQPDIAVEEIGGVIVYCDPDTYPQVLPDTSKWKIAIGLHPKAAPYFNNDQFIAMQEALTDMRVSALGEIGLDRTVNPIHWMSQEKILDKLLGLARPNKPVILHLRGQATETMSDAVYTRALEIVQNNCEPEQKIHLHCFHGSKTQVDTWRRAFPNTYFSFSLKVKNFHEDQIQATRNVPNHRILIETDSPYCTIPSDIRINNPRRIGQVAMILAGIRSQPVAEIFAITRENGKSLYG
ncbi:tatD [Mytilus edulis]|uniref:TatD n=1 Tax=Mytilus edulis TaxID=6550 RepID=A0A8S3VBT1_MYTED|nr:tatD [Mytilus edulis]